MSLWDMHVLKRARRRVRLDMGKKSVQKKDLLILGCIILIALVLRLYKIGAPLSDFHSWRQADTAAVARNFVREKFDFCEHCRI